MYTVPPRPSHPRASPPIPLPPGAPRGGLVAWGLLSMLWGGLPAAAQVVTAVGADGMEKYELVRPEDFPGETWVFYSGKKGARIEQTWTVDTRSPDGPILICTGEPQGYLRTTATFSDFDFGLEWKYPTDENGNSGILLCTTGEDRIWPSAVQVQLHQPKTGSMYGSGGAVVEPEIETQNHFTRPLNHWNELVITSRSGRLTLTINGKRIGETQVQSSHIGSIGLQSEGSEIHFRRIWIRDLRTAPLAPPAPVSGPSAAVDPSVLWGPTLSPCQPCWPARTSRMLPIPLPGSMYYGYGIWDGRPSSAARPGHRELNLVAHGIPLAGSPDLFDSGRGARLARQPAGEWQAGDGRGSMRLARGGRHRH